MAIATAPGRTFEGPVTDQVSRTRTLWAAIKRKPLGMVSAILIVVLVLTAIFASTLAKIAVSTRTTIRIAETMPSGFRLIAAHRVRVRLTWSVTGPSKVRPGAVAMAMGGI